TDKVEQFVDAILQGDAPQSGKAPKKTQRFVSRKIFIEIWILRQKTDRFAAFDKTTITPKNFRAAARWRHEAKNNFQGRAFTGTIRPQQAVHFAWFDA